MSSFDEKTRITRQQATTTASGDSQDDCLVVIYAKELNLLGKRFVLRRSPMKIGRGADNDIVLDGDSVSRRHCHLERRPNGWYIVDDGSTNGTMVNELELRSRVELLGNGDKIKIGPTIFKFLSGEDVEAKYHEEIYQLTIIDGLTQAYNKRYLFEALDREIVRARRHKRPLALVMFDIDHFKQINDIHGHLAGDVVLKDLAAIVRERIRRDELLARYGGEEFVIMAPETEIDGAVALAEDIRRRVERYDFSFQDDHIQVTVSLGCAVLRDDDKSTTELLKRVDERLYEAKRSGRNRVVA